MNQALRADGIQGHDLLNAQRLIGSVCASIRNSARALEGPTLSEIPAAMLSMKTLLDYHSQKRVPLPMTAQLSGKFGVIIYFDDKAAREMLKKLSPSFFVMMMPAWDALEHIHVLEGRLATLSNCLLVAFKVSPSNNKIKNVAKRIHKHLEAADGSSRVTTEPFIINEDSMPFTVGGNTKKSAMDKVLTPLVRKALLQSKKLKKQQSGKEEVIAQVRCDFGDSAREPRTVVLFARQSEDELVKDTTIPKQLWSMLTGRAPPLIDLRVDDRIVVVVEYCSSAANPLADRVVREAVLDDGPVDLVTANPDRFTRRPEEVTQGYARTGDEWYTQGLRTTPSPAEWVKVRDAEDVVKEQLRIGRQGANQLSLYQRMTRAQDRLNAAMDFSIPSSQIDALKHFVREMAIHHGITVFIIIICESPKHKKELQSRQLAPTIARQGKFLASLLPDNVPRRYIILDSTSRYTSEELNQRVKDELATIPGSGKAMLVSTTLDRVVRRQTYFDDLCTLLAANGHMALSFIWDTLTGVFDVNDAVQLRPGA
jgi:hypothetical protein